MHKLTAADPETHSPDLIAENIDQLKSLFPEAFTEGKVDFDVLKQLPLARQPRTTLYALYQGWLDTVLALQAARITGAFIRPDSAEHAAARRDALDAYSQIQRDIACLRARAAKERQINRKVDLNLDIKRLEAELVTLTTSLQSESTL